MINVLELFGGIRACYVALLNLGFHVNTLDYIDNDKKVVDIANAMFNTNYEPKSVINYHYQGNEKVDILIGGSPCQDFSQAGLNAGGNKGSNTRSSLMWEQLRILKEIMPKYYIWENVKGVFSNKHIHNFEEHNKFVENLGYKVYYQILNAKDFKIPQNRERVFVIAIRNDLNQEFNFNNLKKTKYLPLVNFLENNVDKWYFVKVNSYVENHFNKNKATKNYIGKTKIIEKTNLETTVTTLLVEQRRNNSSLILERSNYLVLPRKKDNELIDGSYNRVWKKDNYIGALNITNTPKILTAYETKNGVNKADIYTVNSENYIYDKQTNKIINTIPASGRTAKILENLNDPYFYNRKVNDKDYVNTITASQSNFNHRCNTNKILDKSQEKDLLIIKWNNQLWNVRILTELECFRLMAFSDKLFYKAQKVGSRPQLYKVAGNSIVVTVLESIFKEIFKE